MGAVAISFGVAAAFALAIACCGSNRLSKLAGAYLFASWLLSNVIFRSLGVDAAIAGFAYMDFAAAAAFIILWLRFSQAWIGVIAAALISQMVFHAVYYADLPSFERQWAGILINNILYAVQLVAVTTPTLLPIRRRARLRRRRKSPELASDTAQMAAEMAELAADFGD